MTEHLPERQVVIDLYDGELDTAHTQMCSTDYRECCQPSHDEFVKALDDLIRACEDRVLGEARETVSALEPLLDVEKRNDGYDCCGCTTRSTLLEDALAAIDALRLKP